MPWWSKREVFGVALNRNIITTFFWRSLLANRFKKELDKNYFVATYQSKNITHKVKIYTSSETKAKKEAEKLLIKPFALVSLEQVFIASNKEIKKDQEVYINE